MGNLLNICLSMPNMGSFIFYIIFVFLTPIFLLVIDQETNILNYLPLLVPLAVIMHTVGQDKVFQNLYPKNRDNLVGITSKYILNIIAIVAILYKVALLQKKTNEILAVLVGIVNLALIFIAAPLLIPIVLEKTDKKIKGYGWDTKHNWHMYIVGFLMLVLIIVVEVLLSSLGQYFLA